ncbi:MAG: hypothetical protein V4732_16355 [Pseudomonadota bacterium]
MFYRLAVLIAILILSNFSRAEFVVNYVLGENDFDRYSYELVKMALEKTRDKYGEFTLMTMEDIPHKRRFAILQQGTFKNLVVMRGYETEYHTEGNLTFINFPVDFGLLGWRICFVSPQSREKIAAVKSLDELRRYSVVQGIGWTDNIILRENGFRVLELDGYQNLFKVVAGGRADLFCRSVTELPGEFAAFRGIGNLVYNESFMLTYNMPFFFYLNNRDTLAKQRIQEGLELAFKDGSIMRLWHNSFDASIQFANIQQRRVFQLTNRAIGVVPKGYEKYLTDATAIERKK